MKIWALYDYGFILNQKTTQIVSWTSTHAKKNLFLIRKYNKIITAETYFDRNSVNTQLPVIFYLYSISIYIYCLI